MSGYVMVPGWLLAAKPDGNDVLVYCTLASFGTFDTMAGTYEECRPALSTVAERAELSLSSVKRSIGRLLELGAITRMQRKAEDERTNLPSVYRVIFGSLVATGPREPTRFTGEPTPRFTGEPTLGSPVNPNQEPLTKNQDTKTSATPRGSRCPEDFMPSEQTKAWCQRALPTELYSRAGEELVKFRLHWTNKTGKDATKISWDKAFQAWMINARDRYGVRPTSGAPVDPRSYAERATDHKARVAEAERLHSEVAQRLIDDGVPVQEADKRATEAKRAYLAQEPVASSSPVTYIEGVILNESPKEVTGS